MNNSWSGRISLQELKHSNLLSVITLLEKEEDINQVTQYFSYEHFYVIYCKFWELDRDHDLFIDKHDLARHSDHGELIKLGVYVYNLNCQSFSFNYLSLEYLQLSLLELLIEYSQGLLLEENKPRLKNLVIKVKCPILNLFGFY